MLIKYDFRLRFLNVGTWSSPLPMSRSAVTLIQASVALAADFTTETRVRFFLILSDECARNFGVMKRVKRWQNNEFLASQLKTLIFQISLPTCAICRERFF